MSPSEAKAELHDRLTEEALRSSIPGAAAGLLLDGDTHIAVHGFTSVANPLPVDSHTLFQIGSITKTYTALAVMRLAEAGRLTLDDRVVAHLPDFALADPGVAEEVTILDLLTHQGGWDGDVFADTGDGDDALAAMVARLAVVPRLFPLRARFSYNNAGFYVAGRIVEVVTGKCYETAVRDLVLDPLRLDESAFPFRDVVWRRFALGHVTREEGPVVLRRQALARCANPIGGLMASICDLLAYARFWLGDGGSSAILGERILSPQSMQTMRQPAREADPSISDQVALSWFVRDVGGTRVIWHGGGTTGQKATLQLVPDRGFAVACLTNSDRGGPLHESVVKWALRRLVGVEEPVPAPLDVPPEALRRYAGSYERLRVRLLVTATEGGLTVSFEPTEGAEEETAPRDPLLLGLLPGDGYLVTHGPDAGHRGRFLLGADGTPEYLSMGGRLLRRTG